MAILVSSRFTGHLCRAPRTSGGSEGTRSPCREWGGDSAPQRATVCSPAHSSLVWSQVHTSPQAGRKCFHRWVQTRPPPRMKHEPSGLDADHKPVLRLEKTRRPASRRAASQTLCCLPPGGHPEGPGRLNSMASCTRGGSDGSFWPLWSPPASPWGLCAVGMGVVCSVSCAAAPASPWEPAPGCVSRVTWRRRL